MAGSIVISGYSETRRARQLDLAVSSGEAVVVVSGPGTGKSTLASRLAGLGRPVTGRLAISGVPAGSPDAGARSLFLLQPPFFSPSGDVFRQLLNRLSAHEGRPRTEMSDMLARWCDRAGLVEAARKKAGSLAPGTLQEFALAMVDLCTFEAAVLDEPLGGLSESAAARAARSICSAASRAAVLVLTSDPVRFSGCGARIVRLEPGQAASSRESRTARREG